MRRLLPDEFFPLGELTPLFPGDEGGDSSRQRECRFSLRTADGFRNVFWVRLGSDNSVYCGLAPCDFVDQHWTLYVSAGSTPLNFRVKDFDRTLLEPNKPPKASLHQKKDAHPMPRCHIRSGPRGEHLKREDYFDWYPVRKRFDFVHSFTGPLVNWPVHSKPGKTAVIDYPGPLHHGARFTVSILPIENGLVGVDHIGFEEIVLTAPEFCVCVSIDEYVRSLAPGMLLDHRNYRSKQPRDLSFNDCDITDEHSPARDKE